MTDNAGSTDTTSTDEPKKVTFTPEQQEMLNKIVSERLEQERKAQAKKEEERQKQAEIEKLSGEEKLKAQFKADNDKLIAERDGYIKQTLVLKAESGVAKLGYDAEFVNDLAMMVVGESEEVTTKNIEVIDKLIKGIVAKQVQEKLAKGSPPVPNGKGKSSSDLDMMREVAGIRKKD